MKKLFLFLAASMLTISSFADTFNKVTKVSDLADGDKVLMACESQSSVSAGFKTGTAANKYLEGASATFSSGTTTLTDYVALDLHKSGDYWTFTLGGKPIGHKSGSNDFDTEKKTTTQFAISFDSNGNALIVSQTKGASSATLQFYRNSSSNIFRLYSSNTMLMIQLYKLDSGSVPEKVPTSVTLDKDELEMRVGDADISLLATVLPNDAVDKSVTWGTTDATVATVSEGAVHAVGVGVAKIWVKTTTAEKTDTCYVTIRKKLDMETVTYNAVQKADYLPVGAKVFIGTIQADENYVMSWNSEGKTLPGVSATYGEKRHTVTAPKACLYTVERDGDKYLFVNTDGLYLRTAASDAMNCGANDQYAKWTLGTFDEDNATVTLEASSGSKYLLNNYGYDCFRQYSLNATGMAQLVLYSDKAQTWVDRVKDPKMVIGGTDVTEESGNKVVDYGKVDKWDEADSDGNYWSLSKKIKVEYGDLSDNISITLAGTNQGNFELPIKNGNPLSDIESKDKKSGSYEFTVWFKAKTKGTYTATLTFHTATTGVSDVVVTLKAEAIDPSSDPAYQPQFSATVSSIYLNPNWEAVPYGRDEATFYFSASNLAKPLYCNLHRNTTEPWFPHSAEWFKVWIAWEGDYVELAMNGQKDLGKADLSNIEVVAEVYAYNPGTYKADINFYSLKSDSKTERAIDVTIPITIKVSEEPVASALDDINTTIGTQKIFRDGQLIIIRNGVEYNANGTMLK